MPAREPVTVPVRAAATVVLLRDTDEGLQTYLLHRVGSLAFAAGMSVFPGGAVDPGDRAADTVWTGPAPHTFAQACGVDDGVAIVGAATRELFEETGVALVAPPGGVVRPGQLPESLRDELVQQRVSWPQALAQSGLHLRADLLKPWVRRITPVGPARRYDTCFFVAALPDGQQPDARTTEASGGDWMRPGDALVAATRGRLQLMRPTRVVLTELSSFETATQVLLAPRPTAGPGGGVHPGPGDQAAPRS